MTSGFNWMGDLQNLVGQLVMTTSGTLVPFGKILLAIMTVWGLVMMVIRSNLTMMDFYHQQHLHFGEIILFVFKVIAASTMLQFYSSPLPGTTLSFHQMLPYIGQQLTNVINTSSADYVIQQCVTVIHGMQKPSFANILEVAVYLIIFIEITIMQFAIFCISAFGFVALGVFTMFGPLAIPFFITKRFEALFWAWMENIAAYSLYGPIAAAVSFIFCGVLVGFFNKSVHGNYSLGNFLALIPVMATLVASFLFSMLQVPAFASRLTRGAGDMGQSMISAITRFVGVNV